MTGCFVCNRTNNEFYSSDAKGKHFCSERHMAKYFQIKKEGRVAGLKEVLLDIEAQEAYDRSFPKMRTGLKSVKEYVEKRLGELK
jgi:hypothetical protein